jgi:hypothetical protein
VTDLANGVRKDGDAHIYSVQSGLDTEFPGVAIEVGKGGDLKETTYRKRVVTRLFGWISLVAEYHAFESPP